MDDLVRLELEKLEEEIADKQDNLEVLISDIEYKEFELGELRCEQEEIEETLCELKVRLESLKGEGEDIGPLEGQISILGMVA